jgi:excisionase family DNA binding protein
MIALPQQFQGGTYLTVTEAADFMGCSVGWVRMLIIQKKLDATRVGNRTLLIPQAAAQRAKEGLTTRSLGRHGEAKRPAAKRKPAKKAAKGRSRG